MLFIFASKMDYVYRMLYLNTIFMMLVLNGSDRREVDHACAAADVQIAYQH